MTEYRLRPVRDARDREERTARSTLAGTVGDARATELAVLAATQRVAAVRTHIAEARHARDAQTTQHAFALADRYVHRRLRDLEHAIADELRALAAHHERTSAIDVARGRLARARADRESIERHFATWREQRRKLAERREE